ncbi:hypothetical protein PTE30175_02538 [Pandoraea terrae]|uniref:Uncharacterized protein n=1 Tax=Pandoraea terrae TaxID=1537710 RepID=A0A5E4VE31_9BURK|nr:hypothetical protein PTE30175_02538 [Pandoraea terrae]
MTCWRFLNGCADTMQLTGVFETTTNRCAYGPSWHREQRKAVTVIGLWNAHVWPASFGKIRIRFQRNLDTYFAVVTLAFFLNFSGLLTNPSVTCPHQATQSGTLKLIASVGIAAILGPKLPMFDNVAL